MADIGGSGAYQREEQKQSIVPMEAAEEHFHLMPSRPSVEDEVISGCLWSVIPRCCFHDIQHLERISTGRR